ncbi:hypothetical protein SHL15_8956 [Streptomyces hygroscopicus subsp. limoneus]|nr:hypothetical protein SHL15_8956 [Streptomyces hygroscopicus subsp. limoneus]
MCASCGGFCPLRAAARGRLVRPGGESLPVRVRGDAGPGGGQGWVQDWGTTVDGSV